MQFLVIEILKKKKKKKNNKPKKYKVLRVFKCTHYISFFSPAPYMHLAEKPFSFLAYAYDHTVPL